MTWIDTGAAMDQYMTPMRVRKASDTSGPGADGIYRSSFTRDPIRFIDALYHVRAANIPCNGGSIYFRSGNNGAELKIYSPSAVGNTIVDPDHGSLYHGSSSPQWLLSGASDDWEIAIMSQSGTPLSDSLGGHRRAAELGVFYRVGPGLTAGFDTVFDRSIGRCLRASNTTTYQIRRISDGIVYAQATIEMIYERVY